MKMQSCVSLSETAVDEMDYGQHHIAVKAKYEADAIDQGHKSFKLQTLVEVLRCELARPGQSTDINSELEPTKQWTPTHYAVYHNRQSALLHFLRAGQTPDGCAGAPPLLCIAVAAGHIAIVKILCEAGANITTGCSRSGETALHLAVKVMRNDLLNVLLRHRPNLNARTLHTHETPLHYAAANPGSIDTTVTLLKHGASYEALNHQSRSPAEVALQAHDFNTTLIILRYARAKPHKLEKEKRLLLSLLLKSHELSPKHDMVAQALELACPADSTALVEAINLSDEKIVRLLLQRGADVNKATESGRSPIFAALDACSAPVVQALVEHGADVTLRNAHGLNVLQAALASPLSRDKQAITRVFDLLLLGGIDAHTTYTDGTTLLHRVLGVEQPLVKIAQGLLKRGVSVDAQDRNGNTALHVAATSPVCVTFLLGNGADPNTINSRGLTPLLSAVKLAKGDDEPDLRQLIKASNIGKVDPVGRTALHLAAQNGLSKTVRLLLGARAEATSTDARKRTPLLLAVLNHQWTTIPFLATQPGMNAWDETGLTALHHLAMSTPKAPSTWKSIAAAAVPFCERGVSRSMRDHSGSTPLIQAIKLLPKEGLPVIEALLSQKGSERGNCVAHEDHDGRNALYYAATLGKVVFVETLLRHGTPFVIIEWRPKKRPLKSDDAASKKILKLFAEHEWMRRMGRLHRQANPTSEEPLLSKVLPVRDLRDMLTMGLDPNDLPRIKSSTSLLWVLLDRILAGSAFPLEYLHNALKVAFTFNLDPNTPSALQPLRTPKTHRSNPPQAPLAVQALTYILEQHPHVESKLVTLILDNGADLGISSPLYEGRYALHSAARVNRVDIVDELLRRKVDVNCTDARLRTPLFDAADNGFDELVVVLLRSGAKIEIRDCEGNTPLHGAVAAGSTKIVAGLLRAGAKAGCKNEKGFTPLQCLSDALPDEKKREVERILERGEMGGRRPVPHATAPKATASREFRKPAMRREAAPLPPPPQPSSIAPSTTTTTPKPIHLSKQMLSIRITPPAPQSQPKPAISPITTNEPPKAPRIDSGVGLSDPAAVKGGEMPVLDRRRTSFDPLAEVPVEGEELRGWLSASRMLDRL